MDEKNTTPLRLDEEAFLETLGLTFQEYGYDPQLLESDEFPLALNMVLKDESGSEIETMLMFVPLKALTGDDVQMLQIYFQICSFDKNLPREKLLEIEHIANYCSSNSSVGSFCVQQKVGVVSCKQSLAFRGSYGDENCLIATVDTFLLMLTSINAFYDGLESVAKGEKTLEQALREGLLPSTGR